MTKVKASWKKFCSLKKSLFFFTVCIVFILFTNVCTYSAWFLLHIHSQRWLSALRVELKVDTECGQKAAVLGHVISANISVM